MTLVGSGLATSVIEKREERRRDGWLVPPPIDPARFAHARMEISERGQTVPYPNFEMSQMKAWLESIFEVGGTRQDLARAWGTWQTTFRQQKAPLADHLETLCRRSDKRESDLAQAVDGETRLQRYADMAKTRLDQALANVAEIRRDLEKAAAVVARCKGEVEKAEAELKASKQ